MKEEIAQQIAPYPDILAQLEEELRDSRNGLYPTVLSKGTMSKNANAYYDFYLDGVPNSMILS